MTVEELHEWWAICQEAHPELRSWALVIDGPKVLRAGHCRYKKNEIGISAWALDACDDEIIDTLLHEIAHALDWDVGAGDHGPNWKDIAKRIGADPSPYYSERMAACAPPPKYQIICPKCGIIAERHRQSLNLPGRQCRTCDSTGLQWKYLTQEER
jgi:predicted SprT family Zn-dependent metalloprotease